MASINLAGSIGLPANAAILGTVTINFPTNASVTMTAAQWSNRFISLTSTSGLSGPQNLIAPLIQGIEFIIQNNTTGGQAITVVGATGAGVSIPDGYMVSVACDGSNYLQIGGISVSSGTFTAAGDLSGSSIHQTVTGLQGNPVSSGALSTSNAYNRLQWTGSQWQSVAPSDGEIIGQNLVATAWASCLDDTPIIQAWITQHTVSGACRGTLKLVNPVLKTALNLTAFANTWSKIVIYGLCRYQMNVAEFNMPTGLTISGEGGGYGSASFNIGGQTAQMNGYNSQNSTGQETLNSSTDGYVGSAYEYMWVVSGLSALPVSSVGQILNISAVGSGGVNPGAFIGNYTVACVQSTGSVRLVWIGGGAPVLGDVAINCTWTCDGYSGSALDFTSFNITSQPIPVLPVYQTKNLTNNSYYHWMSLSNCTNSDLNTKIHRIMGIANSTTAYIIGWNLQTLHSLTLPDYGVGGTSSANSTIKIYEATPVFRMTNYNNVRNINATDNQSPVFVMDATDGTCQWNTVENCSAVNTDVVTPAFVPLINDGCFFFIVRKCYFGSNASYANTPASIYLTGTNATGGAYSGFGRVEDCLFTYYGVVTRQEGDTFSSISSTQFTNILVDPFLAYPGQSWNAFMVFDGAAALLQFINCLPGDSDTNTYICESLSANKTFKPSSLTVNSPTVSLGNISVYGPNMATMGVDLLSTQGPISNLAPVSSIITQYSNSYLGYVDNAEVDRNADFSPVMQLPFQITLPPLLTVANWNALPQYMTVTAYSTGADGYALWGPDMSSGKVIRLSTAVTNSNVAICTHVNGITNPQVGDVILVFARMRTTSTTVGLTGANFVIDLVNTNIVLNDSAQILPTLISGANNLQVGGQWQTIISYNRITAVNASPGSFIIYIQPTAGNDLVVDPESFAVCYIPVSQTNVESIPAAELVRQYRKKGGQITGATPGDVAIPTRTGFSFGGLGARISSDMVDGYLQLQAGSAGAITFDGAIQGSSIGSGSPVSYGIANIVMASDANLTLSSSQFTQPILRITSTTSLTATRNIVLPNVSGAHYEVYNHTTGGQSLQFIGSSGAGITVPNGIKTSIYYDGTGYVPAGIVIGGDLSATTNISQTVVALQGNPVAVGALSTSNAYDRLQWNGSAYVATVPADGEIIGQNTLATSWASSLDDTPVIQAWITQHTISGVCRGTLKLVNPVLKTALNLTPFANTYSKIIIYGTCRYAMNVAEFNMPLSLTISGEGGGNGGINALEGPVAYMQGFNSVSTNVQEPNNSTIDGYVGSAYEYMWICTGTTPTTLPASAVGQILTVSSVTGGSSDFVGTYVVAAVQPNNYVRLVYNSGSTLPSYTEFATGCAWTCPGTSGGSTLSFGNFSNKIAVLPVYNCKNLTSASYYHWMALSNSSNNDLNSKIHRIMGIANSTTAYIIGANLQQVHNLTLPDYGIGGTNSSNSTIKVYEATPVFRMTGYNKVQNISAYGNQSPVFVMDGTDLVAQWCTVENCETGQNQVTPAPAFVSLINDGVFFFIVRKCFFYSYTTANTPAGIYLTGTNGACGGAYCGLGRIEDTLFTNYSIVARQESVFVGAVDIEVTNCWTDPPLVYPGTSYQCFFTIDGGTNYIKIINCDLGDPATPCYLVETLSTNYAALSILGQTSISINNITVDNAAVNFPVVVYGPNLAAAGIDLKLDGSPFWTLTPGTSAITQYSASYRGYVDNAEIDRNADFSPTMQLPYQLTLPALLTVANWTALTHTGTVSFSNNGSDGYALWGPDMSSGKVIRITSTSPSSCTVGSWSITTPQVGDILLTFMRVRSVSTTNNLALDADTLAISSPGNGIVFNSYPGGQYISALSPLVPVNLGGQWQNSIGYHTVTTVNSMPGSVVFNINVSSGNDVIIDPESIGICYIPISQANTEVIPIAEIVRQYRKKSGQIAGATPGDVAIPTRAGLSFGGLGARISSDMVSGDLQLQSSSTGTINIVSTETVFASQTASPIYSIAGLATTTSATAVTIASWTPPNNSTEDVFVTVVGNDITIDGYFYRADLLFTVATASSTPVLYPSIPTPSNIRGNGITTASCQVIISGSIVEIQVLGVASHTTHWNCTTQITSCV